ncbi:MAG: hypothetical protein K2I77_03645, partial [Anaeroplasmataceae bacterium]|nr:hypothetical protein [Anaeroplasmataceae bacterium]
IEPIQLETPVLKITETKVTWETINNADAYVVFNEFESEDGTKAFKDQEQTETSFDIILIEKGTYKIKVQAISKDQTKYKDSVISDSVTYVYKEKDAIKLNAPVITLKDNVVSWEAVNNADAYIVKQNGKNLEEQTKTSYIIGEEVEGDYEIEVQAISHTTTSFTSSEFSNKVVYHYEAPFELVPATLYVVGDSTLASFSDSYYYPRYGYGTQLSNFFDKKITVNNLALSGRSSKSFISEANYRTLTNSLSSGDYLLIGFGHNDEKSDDNERFTDASKPITDVTSFKYSLYEYYIKLAIEKGATPILCTPIVRADKNNNYNAANGHVTSTGDYAKAIVELGEEKDVTVVNLRDLTKEKYTELGYNEAIYYHAIVSGKKDGTELVPDVNSVDGTHLNIYGAKYVAYLVASTLKQSNNVLGKYVLSDIKEPTKDTDLSQNPNYTFVDYKAPTLTSYNPASHFKTTTSGWYGTAFGDCGGTPTSAGNGYTATETSEGVFKVGQTASSAKGKFASAGDGFAFLFQQVSKEKNFEITVDAKVLTSASTNQAAFGLMIRDDCYINQSVNKVVITSNYLTAGLVTASQGMNALFYRENSALVTNQNSISEQYQVDDTAQFKITRLGQSITTTVIYKGKTYSETKFDFDLFAVDQGFMYIGMFATRGTVVEFTNVSLTFTGTSQGA